MKKHTTVCLQNHFFAEKERVLVTHGGLRVSVFRYDTSVAAIKVSNQKGEIILLPYQGQQIWRCRFFDRELTMKSMFEAPEPTQEYLRTYGGFFLHCGASAMGVPSKADAHPLHGELPNAPYQQAFVSCGEDERGAYVVVGGQYEHKVAFNHRYLAEPAVKMYEDSAMLDVSMAITNLLKTEMDVMYLAHINFRPVDHAELVYTADYDAEHVRVSVNVPEHIKTSVPIERFKEFLHALQKDPALHHRLDPDALYDPEVVMAIQYKADADGMAHSMQVHPDGCADYVGHRPSQLDQALRWIARTPDQDALGLVLPANTGNGGFLAEKAAGNIQKLAAGKTARFDLRVGLLSPEEVKRMNGKIKAIKHGKRTGDADR